MPKHRSQKSADLKTKSRTSAEPYRVSKTKEKRQRTKTKTKTETEKEKENNLKKTEKERNLKKREKERNLKKREKEKNLKKKTKIEEVLLKKIEEDDEPIEVFIHAGDDDEEGSKQPEVIVLDDDSDDDVELDWDPEVSYVGKKFEVKLEAAGLKKEDNEKVGPEFIPKRRRWIKKGAPIMSRDKIPEEWNWTPQEVDLDYADIDGQIQRCKERIEDGVLPWEFESRLKEYENLRLARDTFMERYPGRTYEVAQRMDELSRIQKHFAMEDDEFEQLPNVKAILEKYKTGQLDWNKGLVTYWSHGKQLCEPRPFDWDEFLRVNKKNKGYHSFWVEGYRNPGPTNQFLHIQNFPGPPEKLNLTMTWYTLKHPNPNTIGFVNFPIVDDTGSAIMSINRNDITLLQHSNVMLGRRAPRIPPLMGTIMLTTADGSLSFGNVVCLQVNVMNNMGRQILPEFKNVEVFLSPVATPGNAPAPRLSGPWLRNQLFTATVPDGNKDLWVFDVKSEYSKVGPRAPATVARDLQNRPDPPPPRLAPVSSGAARNY